MEIKTRGRVHTVCWQEEGAETGRSLGRAVALVVPAAFGNRAVCLPARVTPSLVAAPSSLQRQERLLLGSPLVQTRPSVRAGTGGLPKLPRGSERQPDLGTAWRAGWPPGHQAARQRL